MLSQWTLDAIRTVSKEIEMLNNRECRILGKWFKEYEPDYYMYFSNYHEAKMFVVRQLMKELQ